eukprot:TRINITY_DN45559_c0_g1_i1.p1 TRINITY_DN45559_c0_g1~~TRINITY_DN45559_c0_g1_i1.p1  ORF type:complete len:159 (-),score=33.52 TRINITY_DN45559_c0_g1_i1:88-564(-)
MGGTCCCSSSDREDVADVDGAIKFVDYDQYSEHCKVSDETLKTLAHEDTGLPNDAATSHFNVTLDKAKISTLGIHVDYEAQDGMLLIVSISGGLAEAWNETCDPECLLRVGDSIVEVNGVNGDVAKLLEVCRNATTLNMVVKRRSACVSDVFLAEGGH